MAQSDPSAITRDYVLKLDGAGCEHDATGAPVLSVFGGKITTYRKLAEHALARIEALFPEDGPCLDAGRSHCPAATCPSGGLAAWNAELARRYPAMAGAISVRGIARRHGSLATAGAGRGERRRPIWASTSATD